jgi:hypothetical protein
MSTAGCGASFFVDCLPHLPDLFKAVYELIRPPVWFALHAVAAAGAVLLIYKGAAGLARKEQRRRALLHIGYGALICLAFAGKSLWVSHVMEGLLDQEVKSKANTLAEFPETWGADLKAADREKKSIVVASIVFRESGRFRRYVTKDGVWQVYSPTSEDIAERDFIVETRVKMNALAEDGYETGLRWFGLAVAAAFLGLRASWKRRSDSPADVR